MEEDVLFFLESGRTIQYYLMKGFFELYFWETIFGGYIFWIWFSITIAKLIIIDIDTFVRDFRCQPWFLISITVVFPPYKIIINLLFILWVCCVLLLKTKVFWKL